MGYGVFVVLGARRQMLTLAANADPHPSPSPSPITHKNSTQVITCNPPVAPKILVQLSITAFSTVQTDHRLRCVAVNFKRQMQMGRLSSASSAASEGVCESHGLKCPRTVSWLPSKRGANIHLMIRRQSCAARYHCVLCSLRADMAAPSISTSQLQGTFVQRVECTAASLAVRTAQNRDNRMRTIPRFWVYPAPY